MAEMASRTVNKVMWRLLPFLMACYFVAFLDRVNVGFAHLQMSRSLGRSEAAFGFGAGAFFMLPVPVSSVIGAPISGFLLNITGLGMEGWQWMYILEGLPSVLMAIAVWFYLTEYPRAAGWLEKDEADWLQGTIAREQALT